MQGSITKSNTTAVNKMNSVYSNMFLAVLNSMLVSYAVSSSPALMGFLFSGAMLWVVILAPLVAVLIIAGTMSQASRSGAVLMLHGFAALMGLSLSTIFAVYTTVSIVQAFLGAACLFLTMSLYGYTTKRDLTSIGQFLFAGLIAIIVVSLFNLFLGSGVVAMAVSAIAVVIFLGLTAHDTQKIRQMIVDDNVGNADVQGALTLYLDFINLFIHLLHLFGGRK